MSETPLVAIVSALLGAGLLAFVKDAVVALWRRFNETTPEAEERRAVNDDLVVADKTSLLLVRDNEALSKRNTELYAELQASDARHERQRQEWERDRSVLMARHAQDMAARRTEYDALEQQLRETRGQLQTMVDRVEQQLDELVELRTRHA